MHVKKIKINQWELIMKRLIHVLIIICVFLLNLEFAQTFMVQGVLRDPAGRTVQNGSHSVTFKLYDAESGGTELWSEVHGSLTTEHGVFTALLGESSALSGVSFVDPMWIGITVDDGNEISPRMALVNSPSANAVSGYSNVLPSTGNVGIGTKNPQFSLEINGSAPYVGFTDSDGGSVWSLGNYGLNRFTVLEGSDERFVIAEGGNVGVGTTAPVAPLHVAGTTYLEDRIMLMRPGGHNYIDFNNSYNLNVRSMTTGSSDVVDIMTIEPSGDVGIGTEPTEKLEVYGNMKLSNGGALIFSDGTSLSSASLSGSASSVSTPGNALITADADEAGTGEVQFKTGTSTDMVVTNDGKVGIGTTAPTTHLEVSGSGVQRIKVASTDDNQAGISFKSGGTGEYVIYSSGGSDDLTFYNGTSDVMNLTAAGNLGIGTFTPSERLHVAGSSYFEDRLRLMRTAGPNYLDFYNGENFYLRSIGTDDSNGNIRFSVTPDGNVGIGTSTPGALLDLTGATPYIKFTDTDAGSSWLLGNYGGNRFLLQENNVDRFVVAEGGNVGVNNAAPDAKLSIDADGDGDLFNIHTSHTTDAKIFQVEQSGSDGYVKVNDANGNTNVQLSGYSSGLTFFKTKVGIGTSTPAYKFDLNADVAANWLGRFRNVANGAAVYVSNADGYGMSINPGTNADAGTYALQVHKGDGGVSLYAGGAGKVGIGTNTPVAPLHVVGSAYLEDRLRLMRPDGVNYVDFNTDYHLMFRAIGTDDTGGAGVFELHSDGTAWLAGGLSQNSDRRLKYDINTVGNALNKVMQMRGVTYRWNQNQPGGRVPDSRIHYGFVAQEVEEVLPEIVVENSNGYKTVSYSEVSSVLVEAIKEQQQLIKQLEKENTLLNNRLRKMEHQFADFEKLMGNDSDN